MGKWSARQIDKRWSEAFLLILLVSLVSVLPIRAQESGGTILGVVTDPSGAAVANANVSIKNVATGVERSVPTNDDGVYVAPNLVPGGYEVRIDAAGISSPVVGDHGLTVWASRASKVCLQVCQSSDKSTIVVSARYHHSHRF